MMNLTNLQITWIAVGLVLGVVLMIPIKRCFATHNGIVSMLIASLMGIFYVPNTWIAVVIALGFFTYGFYKNHDKYIGVTNDDPNRT